MARLDPEKIPRHVAIIPDGNGRWAEARGLPRNVGHKQGVETVRETVRACSELGIRRLTLYAFSQENWDRPRDEVRAIMSLLQQYLANDAEELCENRIRVEAIGRLDELEPRLRHDLEALIRRTERFDQMQVTFALSYSGRREIVDATRRIAGAVESGVLDPSEIDEKTLQANLYAPDAPDPDLLIRTGHEYRISNFLLWQLAYTELYVSESLWPDFGKTELVEALWAYQQRERRFGRTSAQLRREP
ncbi:MAG: polyprenyl diphosphate synthase [Myxococcota bacterium]